MPEQDFCNFIHVSVQRRNIIETCLRTKPCSERCHPVNSPEAYANLKRIIGVDVNKGGVKESGSKSCFDEKSRN